MPVFAALATALAVTLFVVPAARAATFDDPEWPCIQRKVAHLSAGLMWPHPLPDDPELDAQARELADTLALRRITLDQTADLIAAYAAAHPGIGTEDLGAIFLDLFDRLDRQRGSIMDGIARYSLQQIALSDRIDATRVEMDTALAAESPDFDRIDTLEEQLDWDERIYRDRALSLTYVCETPVLLERRLYGIAQQLLAHVPG